MNPQPDFLAVYCGALRRFDAQMYLAAANLEYFELNLIVDHDRLTGSPG